MLKVRRKKCRAIPWRVSCAATLLPHEPYSLEWVREVRRLIQSKISHKRERRLMDVYDDHLVAIIREEYGRN